MLLKKLPRTLLSLLALLLCSAVVAAEPEVPAEDDPPLVALIIDDMGNLMQRGERALALPGKVTYSFLPHTPYARQQADQAYRLEREVMLHLPMESLEALPLGEGALLTGMTSQEQAEVLAAAVSSVPHLAGINNHMGSLMTADGVAMQQFMALIRDTGLFFLDSRTTDKTLAEQSAQENLVATGRRDVFLDNLRQPEAIRAQFKRLLALARSQGHAIGIAHPHPETLEVLEALLPELEQQGIRLVPVSQLINQGRSQWHASSSPSPKAVKSSKPSPSQIY
ncbi:divergent polysaccharide deacetylase family protein [endosymbiont of Ridgeia piscesae]|jgi:polysaccharide deacetylase 2 family uncharacterized protein YibQ|uniref:Divergent polysaccharide deacetylase n=1 Tax=endosymbiont of Ridgeia piscesae TaxID=54398 RepID=A0A0T5Z908_9GAMM|nr:divergent polysaccharide deacetylase family protein [endosymbiont of Ridgeia piscesae]KRT59396.1 hypothetical protein Ga0076813_15406 [endosymbiont of Ridgeia piscesae]